MQKTKKSEDCMFRLVAHKMFFQLIKHQLLAMYCLIQLSQKMMSDVQETFIHLNCVMTLV